MIWLQFCDAQYALDNIVYMMTSWKPGDPDFECIKANFMYLMDGIASIPFMWLRGRYYRAIKAHECMCKTLLQVVERRRSGQEKHDDFIQHLVDCETLQNEAEKQSDLQLLDNLVLMMFAGHETSSITIMWLLKYLEDNPLVQETLREEHEEILRKKVNPDALLTWEEASSMPYTLKVWNLLVSTFLMFSAEDFFCSSILICSQDATMNLLRKKARQQQCSKSTLTLFILVVAC
jgi:cytochrome P450